MGSTPRGGFNFKRRVDVVFSSQGQEAEKHEKCLNDFRKYIVFISQLSLVRK